MSSRDSNGGYDNKCQRAFNEGSDARIAGETPAANPHLIGTQEAIYWQQGWEDVNKHWGKWASWAVRRLPSIGFDP